MMGCGTCHSYECGILFLLNSLLVLLLPATALPRARASSDLPRQPYSSRLLSSTPESSSRSCTPPPSGFHQASTSFSKFRFFVCERLTCFRLSHMQVHDMSKAEYCDCTLEGGYEYIRLPSTRYIVVHEAIDAVGRGVPLDIEPYHGHHLVALTYCSLVHTKKIWGGCILVLIFGRPRVKNGTGLRSCL
ncbi:hypothetical protein BDY19DRAFT_685170 [Irpex rosettiformis]|uniref:Uncharacterized protein n=1 Tax=Irpex rosettiformis TaxID=378272 RepID=A0ACB8UAD6_9APHY|nr:hypothetical protein BDY19DRAFT_685170 [Irpex rosettiformis]